MPATPVYTQSQLNAHKAAQERARRRNEAARRAANGNVEARVSDADKPKEYAFDFASFATSVSFSIKPHSDYTPYGIGFAGGQSECLRTMDQIARGVLKAYPGITLADIKGSRRTANIYWPRHHIVHSILAERPDISSTMLGRWMGGRDHTSILNSKRQWENKLQREKDNASKSKHDADASRTLRGGKGESRKKGETGSMDQ